MQWEAGLLTVIISSWILVHVRSTWSSCSHTKHIPGCWRMAVFLWSVHPIIIISFLSVPSQSLSYVKSGVEKSWIPACPLGKQLSHLLVPGHILLALGNDFVTGWLAAPLPIGQVSFKSYLPSKKMWWNLGFWKTKRTRSRVIGVHFRDFFYQGRRRGVLVRVSGEFELSELELTVYKWQKRGVKSKGNWI